MCFFVLFCFVLSRILAWKLVISPGPKSMMTRNRDRWEFLLIRKTLGTVEGNLVKRGFSLIPFGR